MSMANHLMRAAGKPRASVTAGKRTLTPSQASLLASMRSGFRLQYSNRTGLFCLNNPARQGVTYSARALLALPGGFVKHNQRIKEAAVAEVMEETGILLAEGKRAEEITHDMLMGSIVDSDYFDHPTRSLRGRTVTHAFLMRLKDAKALPLVKAMPIPAIDGGDGIEMETLDSQWLDINTALSHPEWWFEDHHDILETMHARLKE